MSLPPVIGIHGVKRSGKGTVAAYLEAVHGYRPVKFAGALKAMARVPLRTDCGLSEADVERCIEGDLKEIPIPALGGKSARYLMQVLGTEYRDMVHQAMWREIAACSIRGLAASGGRAAVDDLRFMHELPVLRVPGARTWMVSSSKAALRAEPPTVVLPWDPAAPPVLGLGPDVIRGMIAELLAHCGLDPDAVGRSLDGDLREAPIALLGGRSAGHARRMLAEGWVGFMAAPWTPGAASTAGHASEQTLPREEFDAFLTNDGTFAELYAQVDAALARDAEAAAA